MRISSLLKTIGLIIAAFIILVGVITLLFMAALYLFGDPAPIRINGSVYHWLDAPPGATGEISIGITSYSQNRLVESIGPATITFWYEDLTPLGFQNILFPDSPSGEFRASIYAKPIPNNAIVKVEVPGFHTITQEFIPTIEANFAPSIDIFLVKDPGFDPLALSLPVAPEGISISPHGADEVYIQWQKTHYFESGFRIERATDPEFFEHLLINFVDSGKGLYIDDTTQARTTYWYRVVAFNSAGDSLNNPVFKVKTGYW